MVVAADRALAGLTCLIRLIQLLELSLLLWWLRLLRLGRDRGRAQLQGGGPPVFYGDCGGKKWLLVARVAGVRRSMRCVWAMQGT